MFSIKVILLAFIAFTRNSITANEPTSTTNQNYVNYKDWAQINTTQEPYFQSKGLEGLFSQFSKNHLRFDSSENSTHQPYPPRPEGQTELAYLLPEFFRFVESLMVIMYNKAQAQAFSGYESSPNIPTYSGERPFDQSKNNEALHYQPYHAPIREAYDNDNPFYNAFHYGSLSPSFLPSGPDVNTNAEKNELKSSSLLLPLKSIKPAENLNKYCVFQGISPINQYDCYKYLVCLPSKYNKFEAYIAYCPDDKRFSRTYRRCVLPYLVPECFRNPFSQKPRFRPMPKKNKKKSEVETFSAQTPKTFNENHSQYPSEIEPTDFPIVYKETYPEKIISESTHPNGQQIKRFGKMEMTSQSYQGDTYSDYPNPTTNIYSITITPAYNDSILVDSTTDGNENIPSLNLEESFNYVNNLTDSNNQSTKSPGPEKTSSTTVEYSPIDIIDKLSLGESSSSISSALTKGYDPRTLSTSPQEGEIKTTIQTELYSSTGSSISASETTISYGESYFTTKNESLPDLGHIDTRESEQGKVTDKEKPNISSSTISYSNFETSPTLESYPETSKQDLPIQPQPHLSTTYDPQISTSNESTKNISSTKLSPYNYEITMTLNPENESVSSNFYSTTTEPYMDENLILPSESDNQVYDDTTEVSTNYSSVSFDNSTDPSQSKENPLESFARTKFKDDNLNVQKSDNSHPINPTEDEEDDNVSASYEYDSSYDGVGKIIRGTP